MRSEATVQCDAMRCDAVRCDAMRCDAVPAADELGRPLEYRAALAAGRPREHLMHSAVQS